MGKFYTYKRNLECKNKKEFDEISDDIDAYISRIPECEDDE